MSWWGKWFSGLVMLAIVPAMGLAQESSEPVELPTDEEGKVVYEAVVQVSGVMAEELQRRAREWIRTYFRNPAEALKTDEPGKLVVQYKIRLHRTDPKTGRTYPAGFARFTLTLRFKDGRYKYRVDEIFYLSSRRVYIHEWLDSPDPEKQEFLRQIDAYITEMLTSMRTYIKEPPQKSAEDDEDW